MKCVLTFGRVLMLQTEIEAKDEKDALNQAFQMEQEGKLTVSPITLTNPGVELVDVQDDEEPWEVKPAGN